MWFLVIIPKSSRFVFYIFGLAIWEEIALLCCIAILRRVRCSAKFPQAIDESEEFGTTSSKLMFCSGLLARCFPKISLWQCFFQICFHLEPWGHDDQVWLRPIVKINVSYFWVADGGIQELPFWEVWTQFSEIWEQYDLHIDVQKKLNVVNEIVTGCVVFPSIGGFQTLSFR